MNEKYNKHKGIFVLGVVSIVMSFTGLTGAIIGGIGIILGKRNMKYGTNPGEQKKGVILSIIGTSVSVMSMFTWIFLLGSIIPATIKYVDKAKALDDIDKGNKIAIATMAALSDEEGFQDASEIMKVNSYSENEMFFRMDFQCLQEGEFKQIIKDKLITDPQLESTVDKRINATGDYYVLVNLEDGIVNVYASDKPNDFYMLYPTPGKEITDRIDTSYGN